MRLSERIKILRIDQSLSQSAFGMRLGVSRSVINNLERGTIINENSKRPLIKLMSREFSVSEEWLLRGSSAQIEYLPEHGTKLRRRLEDNGANGFEIEMIRAYLQLDHVQRRVMLQTFQDLFNHANEIINRISESKEFE